MEDAKLRHQIDQTDATISEITNRITDSLDRTQGMIANIVRDRAELRKRVMELEQEILQLRKM